MKRATPIFRIGDRVDYPAFVDCFGKMAGGIAGLVVVESRKIESDYIATYFRIKAIGRDGFGYVEAAERFFVKAPPIGWSSVDTSVEDPERFQVV